MFLDDMVTLLETASLGTRGTSIFWGSGVRVPDGDGPYLSLIETGGLSPIVMHVSEQTPGYRRPSAQITARASDWTVARAKIEEVYQLFTNPRKQNVFINSVWYVSIDVVQDPFDLPPDDRGRVRCAFNINAVKRPAATP